MKQNLILVVLLVAMLKSGDVVQAAGPQITTKSPSRVLFVSDIDDTLKISRVRSRAHMVWYGYFTGPAFRGMSQLYNLFKKENPNTDFVYLSNAIEFLMEDSHEDFLERHGFPKGLLWLRSGDKSQHKYLALKQLILSGHYKRVILVGDNGEMDPLVYARISQEFSAHIEIETFVRTLYSDRLDGKRNSPVYSLRKDQVPFITPLEILAHFLGTGDVRHADYIQLGNQVASQILAEKKVSRYSPHYMPHWVNCENAELNVPSMASAMILRAYNKLKNRCRI